MYIKVLYLHCMYKVSYKVQYRIILRVNMELLEDS